MNLTVKIGALVLANGTWEVGVVTGELPKAVRRLIDVAAGIGAAGPTNFDRMRRDVTVDFTITRSHVSPEAALEFYATHDTVATGVAALVMEAVNGDGAGVRLTMSGAAWESVTTDPKGLSTDTRYHVTGGPFVAVAIEDGVSPLAVRDGLYSGEPYTGGMLWFPAPWNGPVHGATITSVRLADMAT
jgi:hypothetical protein